MLASKLREAKHRGEVHGDNFVPVFDGVFGSRRAPNHAGVIHQNIYGPKFGYGFFDQAGAHFGIGHIACKIKCLLAESAELIANVSRLRIASVATDVRPRFAQRDCNGGSQASMRARHQRVPAVQLE